jgi:hypothetical protein
MENGSDTSKNCAKQYFILWYDICSGKPYDIVRKDFC